VCVRERESVRGIESSRHCTSAGAVSGAGSPESQLPMTSALSDEGVFELRAVVKPLAFVRRHLALLALCHLFGRQTTRKSDILYTYSVVALDFHFRFELNMSE